MTLGDDAFDKLAFALSETDFDAVERDGLRAAWSADGTEVRVSELDGDRTITYNGEDLLRATSDAELSNAREPDQPE